MRFINRVVLMIFLAGALTMISVVTANAQKTRAGATTAVVVQQPLMSEYKGIHLGMTTEEVRTKLGSPALKADDQDYYAFSETETAQFAYDATHTLVTISIDYSGPGAPDYHNVVGPTVEQRADGSQYKIVRYEAK